MPNCFWDQVAFYGLGCILYSFLQALLQGGYPEVAENVGDQVPDDFSSQFSAFSPWQGDRGRLAMAHAQSADSHQEYGMYLLESFPQPP